MIPIFGANTFIENVDGRAIIGVIDDAEEVMAKLLKIMSIPVGVNTPSLGVTWTFDNQC